MIPSAPSPVTFGFGRRFASLSWGTSSLLELEEDSAMRQLVEPDAGVDAGGRLESTSRDFHVVRLVKVTLNAS